MNILLKLSFHLIIKTEFILGVTFSETFSSGTSFPVLITGSIENVIDNQTYHVQVLIMQTDLSGSTEKAEIFLNGVSYGYCDGGNVRDGTCDWYNCESQITSNQIISSTTSVDIRIEYTSSVSSTFATCTDSSTGNYGGGVARVVLSPVGKIETIILFSIESLLKSFEKVNFRCLINYYNLISKWKLGRLDELE